MIRQSLPQGAEVNESGVQYRIWAPACRRLDLEIFEPAGRTVVRTLPLERSDDGYFDVVDPQGKAGDFYKFRLNGENSFPDPASRWQPHGVHGPSMVIDPHRYQWRDHEWKRHELRDFVIYELHIGAFTPHGTFQSAIERLAYLKELGVTAIELMPIADFPGNRNWGYDGVCLYAPAHAYGHPDDLRALVDAAHAIGLTVILDVVYNHFGPDGNYLGCYVGGYLDESKKTPWGGAIRYGDPAFKPLRSFVAANPGYWMREFHIDAFRFDATHAIADRSPRHILQEMTDAIHSRGGLAIAEDSRNDSRLILPEIDGGLGFDAVWADDFHHVTRVAGTRESHSYLGDFKGTVDEMADTLRHGWLYRGQYSRYRRGSRGTECRHLAPEKFVHCISNHDQVGNRAFGDRFGQTISRPAYLASSALLCLSPYLPMLFMGQEWNASTPFLFFTDHRGELGKLVSKGRREEFKEHAEFSDPAKSDAIPDPQRGDTFAQSKLNWSELQSADQAAIVDLYRECLALRKKHGAFRPRSRDLVEAADFAMGAGALRLKDRGGDWLILFDLAGGHSGIIEEEMICSPHSGSEWKIVLSTNEKRFGGTGRLAVDLASMRLIFSHPELVVLHEQKQ